MPESAYPVLTRAYSLAIIHEREERCRGRGWKRVGNGDGCRTERSSARALSKPALPPMKELLLVGAASAQIGAAMSFCDILMSLASGGAVMSRVLVCSRTRATRFWPGGGRLENLALSQFLSMTDGAPRNGEDAQAHGFLGTGKYRVARRREKLAAFALAGLHGLTCSRWWELRGSERSYVSDQTGQVERYLARYAGLPSKRGVRSFTSPAKESCSVQLPTP